MLTDAEVKAMIRKASGRDALIVQLLAESGIRVGELVGLAAAALIGALAVWWRSGETTVATLAAVVAAVLAATGPLAGWLPTRTPVQGTIEVGRQMTVLE